MWKKVVCFVVMMRDEERKREVKGKERKSEECGPVYLPLRRHGNEASASFFQCGIGSLGDFLRPSTTKKDFSHPTSPRIIQPHPPITPTLAAIHFPPTRRSIGVDNFSISGVSSISRGAKKGQVIISNNHCDKKQ